MSPSLAERVAPTDTVFIVARAAQGPKLPLAVVRRTVQDLPVKFTLDDSLAMAPGLARSNFTAIVVVARISKTGGATAQSCDLVGQSEPVPVGAANLTVTIDRALP